MCFFFPTRCFLAFFRPKLHLQTSSSVAAEAVIKGLTVSDIGDENRQAPHSIPLRNRWHSAPDLGYTETLCSGELCQSALNYPAKCRTTQSPSCLCASVRVRVGVCVPARLEPDRLGLRSKQLRSGWPERGPRPKHMDRGETHQQ